MKVSVIGLGYVGSVAAASFAAAGHQVLAIDRDHARLEAFRCGSIPFYEPGLPELVTAASDSGSLRFLHNDQVSGPLGDVIVIAVGTPPNEAGGADLSQVLAALHWVKGVQRERAVVVMKSTVPPGTGQRLQETVLKNSPLRYVSNPEFLREGQAVSDWRHPDRIVIGGDDPDAIALVRELYRDTEAPLVITDVTSAEMIKYASNAFLATKISFINEIAILCDRVGATIDDVTRGMALDPRVGHSFLRAGVGYGGSCFPKDVRALDFLALTFGQDLELLRSVITVNNRQRLLPLVALRELFGSLSEVTVGVLGLAFKPHTDDVREAPAITLVNLLAEEGALVRAYDPRAIPMARRVINPAVTLTDALLGCVDGCQALVLVTE